MGVVTTLSATQRRGGLPESAEAIAFGGRREASVGAGAGCCEPAPVANAGPGGERVRIWIAIDVTAAATRTADVDECRNVSKKEFGGPPGVIGRLIVWRVAVLFPGSTGCTRVATSRTVIVFAHFVEPRESRGARPKLPRHPPGARRTRPKRSASSLGNFRGKNLSGTFSNTVEMRQLAPRLVPLLGLPHARSAREDARPPPRVRCSGASPRNR